MWEYRARLLRVLDGDTIVVEADLGFSVRTEQHLRLLGVSAPEHNQPGGTEATTFTAGWLRGCTTAREWPLLIITARTTADEPTERRTFVRYLATVRDLAEPLRVLNVDLAEFLAAHPEWGTGS